MRRTTILLAAACLALAGCSSDAKPDPAACRKAIKAQYVPGTVQLKGKPGQPKECDGLTTDQVSGTAESVIEELSK
jgi:ABC-type glycerol-3-phosphate transport system substrate-binding protein